jgi:hypothetical protein
LDEGRPENAETPLHEVAVLFSAERASDHEAEANAMLAQVLSAQHRSALATEAAQRAETLAKNSERPRVRILVHIELARLRIEESPPDARRQAEAALADARQLGSKGLELEAGLALVEIEAAGGFAPRSRERLLTLERDAREHGFERIARTAIARLRNR